MSTTPDGTHVRSLPRFVLLTFALAWSAWFAAARIPLDRGSAWSALRSTVMLVGVFAPAIVALVLSARERGRAAASALVAQIGRWRVGAGWYLFAAFYMVAVKLTVAVVYRVVTGTWPRFGDTPWLIMIVAVVTSTLAQAGEEIGWRGYALPCLAEGMGPALASVLLGVIWAAWHLPLFYILGGDTVGQSFPLFLLQVTALSVAMAWLYFRTSGSLLLVMLMHAAVNNTKDIVPSAGEAVSNPMTFGGTLVFRLTVAVMWVGAVWFLVALGRGGRSSEAASPVV